MTFFGDYVIKRIIKAHTVRSILSPELHVN